MRGEVQKILTTGGHRGTQGTNPQGRTENGVSTALHPHPWNHAGPDALLRLRSGYRYTSVLPSYCSTERACRV